MIIIMIILIATLLLLFLLLLLLLALLLTSDSIKRNVLHINKGQCGEILNLKQLIISVVVEDGFGRRTFH